MKQILCMLFLTIVTGPVVAEPRDWLDYRGLIELQLFDNTGSKSWYQGGFGKLRYDQDTTPVQLGKAALHIDLHATDTLWLRTLATAHTEPGLKAGIVESYLNYRPVPHGPLRMRAKAGAFHLPLSLENKDIGWSSLYSTTPSVINSWGGEEVRVIGTELALEWPGRPRQSAHDFTLTGGLFGFNDGIATLISYRGWAQHDRQTPLDARLRLIPEFAGQIREFDPFREIDDRVGYYVSGQWSWLQKIEMNALHYDNRAEPTAIRNRQIAWQTSFDHVSIQIELPGETRLLGQYLLGDTLIDNRVTGFSTDADFSAWYVMLSRRIDAHRISARYENFAVDDHDVFKAPVHNSEENGHSWMLAWRWQWSKPLHLGLEWLQIKSERDGRFMIENIRAETEKQILFNIGYRF